MAKRHKRNPKMPGLTTLAVLGAAAYGAVKLWPKFQGGTDWGSITNREDCRAAGGTWMLGTMTSNDPTGGYRCVGPDQAIAV